MDKLEKELINAINHYKQSLLKYSAENNINEGKLLYYIKKLHHYPVKIKHLEVTGIGLTVNGLRKLGGEVADSAKHLITKWKKMVVEESSNQDDDDDDDEDDEEQEEEELKQKVHVKIERQSSEERNAQKESKHKLHNHKKERHKETSSSSHKHNSEKKYGDEYKQKTDKHELPRIKTEKSSKRKHEAVDSDDEKRSKRKQSENSSSLESDVDEKYDIKSKHRIEKKTKNSSDDESDREKLEKSKHKKEKSSSKHKGDDEKGKQKKKDKEKHKTEERSKSSSKHENHKGSGDKSKNKHSNNKKDVSKPPKIMHSDGINSESGASFAEALGMLEPSTSKITKKKVASPLRVDKSQSASSSKVKHEVIPTALLKPPQSEPVDINISSLLPTITPNYRPLGNVNDSLLHQRHRANHDDEALSRVMSSKNQRTKVYSGNKSIWGYVPTLFELCTRILQDNIDALEYTGGVPYSILKPVLEKATPNQLFQMEHHNPYLIEDTDELWQLHCMREFKNKQREELETWREMYMRCLDEREAKLIALTANIKQSQDKSMPVRQTKLAYVDSFVKPPREIARKQAKNGTRNAITPSLKLASLATAGPAGQISVPNPGPRAAERSGGSSSVVQKPKKAPLMQKTLAAFKNRYRR